MSRSTSNSGKLCVGFAIALGTVLWDADALAIEPTEKGFARISGPVELTQNDVTSIVQDRFGFLWFGTQDGLIRYDGYEFSIFRHDRSDDRSLAASFVRALHKDHLGRLWVGTDLGINLYAEASNDFIRFSLTASGTIYDIAEDADGRIWLGTADGLYVFDERHQRFDRLSELDRELANYPIRSLAAGQDGSIWIGTSGGLAKLSKSGDLKLYLRSVDSDTGRAGRRGDVRSVTVDTNGRVWVGLFEGGIGILDAEQNRARWRHDIVPANIRVSQVLEDSSGLVWIGTVANGVVTFDPVSRKIERMRNQPSDVRSISHDRIRSIFEDNSGLIWLGTGPGGVNRYNRQSENVAHYRYRSADPGSLSHNEVSTIHVDSAGTVWVGTFGGGLNKFDGSGSFQHYRHDPENDDSLNSDRVFAVLVDSAGDLWIGTGENGLNRYESGTQSFKHYVSNPLDDGSLAHNRVRVLYEDRSGRIWIGTAGGGLDLYDRDSDRFVHYTHDSNDPMSISENSVRFILEDSAGYLWIGTTTAGLNRFDRDLGRFTRFSHEPGHDDSLTHNRVQAMYESSDRRLWVGTPAGLTELDHDGKVTHSYSRQDGLANDIVYCILGEENGILWLSTNLGISRFSPETGEFENFDVGDGLQANEFFAGSCAIGKDGTAMFGGVNGLTAFKPAELTKRANQPNVVLTELQLSNRVEHPQPGNSEAPLTEPLLLTRGIELKHHENTVAIKFAALDFASPSRIRYAYTLSGFDADWIETDAQNRTARYSNLSPGQYQFLVRASSSAGIWSAEIRKLDIAVLPPPWLTIWALASYAAIAMIIGFLLFAESRRRTRFLENLVSERTAKLKEQTLVAQRAVQARSVFLAKMSHEIRTPINAVIGILQLLSTSTLSEKERDYVHSAHDAATALLAIVDQILLFSRLEQNPVDIEKLDFSPHRLFEGVSTLMQAVANERKLTLITEIAGEVPDELNGDPDKIRQVCLNLVSNAARFTEQGSVKLSIEFKSGDIGPDRLLISVSDTGIGMSPQAREKIFDAFAQADSSFDRQYGGTGLGLAITKELVAAMNGEISVSSEPDIGSTFVVDLPVTQSGKTYAQLSRLSIYPKVMIIEDVAVNRRVIAEHLRSFGHEVSTFASGQDAIDAYSTVAPSLVIVDINMPNMDGMDVARRIREMEQQKHAFSPIVALTASTTESIRNDCLAAGIDGVLQKPFDYQRLGSLLENIYVSHIDPEWLSFHSVTIGDDSAKRHLAEAAHSIDSVRHEVIARLDRIDREFLSEAIHKVRGIAESFGCLRLSATANDVDSLIGEDRDDNAVTQALQAMLQTAAMTKHSIEILLSSGAIAPGIRDTAL